MAEQWQFRRGTTSENDDFTGVEAEVTVDTTTHELRVHDGLIAGGYKILNEVDINTILSTLYPVGSIYIGTQDICPLTILIPDSTWELIEGRYLLASGTLNGTNETFSATDMVGPGLPNITGTAGMYWTERNVSGAFFADSSIKGGERNDPHSKTNLGFNASYSNSIYGSSTTVRPTAYVVNVWRRTA